MPAANEATDIWVVWIVWFQFISHSSNLSFQPTAYGVG